MFVRPLIIEKIPNTIYWTLKEPLVWDDGSFPISVPRGFKTDLTTRWFEGRHTEASVLHDYLLVTGHPWPVANHMMYQAMLTLNVHPLRRSIIMLGVNTYGWLKQQFNGLP